MAKTFLERHGFEVVIAHDGEEGLTLIADQKPDLVLLDVMLPRLDGFQVCERIKGNKSTSKIPVLMFTAKGLSKDVEQGQEAGADEYIIKPFSGKALVATIRKHLGLEE